jgi:hypothetical protein
VTPYEQLLAQCGFELAAGRSCARPGRHSRDGGKHVRRSTLSTGRDDRMTADPIDKMTSRALAQYAVAVQIQSGRQLA